MMNMVRLKPELSSFGEQPKLLFCLKEGDKNVV